jgi:2-methylcitrate dehydratase
VTDRTTADIARRSHELRDRTIPDTARTDARIRLTDTLACLAGGLHSPPAQVAAKLAATQRSEPPATVLGTGIGTSVELAAFANGVAARYLDFNDTYTGPASGHPSDMIPALLAVAESVHASGKDLLTAIVCGYEAFGAIGKTVKIRARGWDQGVLIGIGVAAGSALLLGCDLAATEHAIGLAATMAIPTRSTRAGALSMWKGCATAASARFGVFAATLAANGMTAPERAIEGKDGLWQQVTGEFAVRPFGEDDPWVISSTAIKLYPLEYNAQIGVELMRQVRERVRPEDVASIRVDTYWSAFDEIGNEPEKWDPRTRETADHSLPYLLAVSMVDGQVTEDSFDAAHLHDPAIRALMAKVTVHEDAEFTRIWPAAVPCRLTVVRTDGSSHPAQLSYPLGHPARPAPPAEIEAKFTSVTGRALGAERATAALETLRRTEELADVAEIVRLFAPERQAAHG